METDYPPCLRRTDAGGKLMSRTQETEADYRARYAGMARSLGYRPDDGLVHPVEIAELVARSIARRAGELTDASFRQYRSAVLQHLRDLWSDGLITIEAAERIDAILRPANEAKDTAASGERKQGGSSRRYARSVSESELSGLVTVLIDRPTPVRRIAAAMLEYGVVLVTRPGEFLTLAFDEAGTATVRSAKYSEHNGRGLDERRPLHMLSELEPFEIGELREITLLISAELERNPSIPHLRRRCAAAIRAARKKLEVRRRIVAYSTRHQGRANLVLAGLSRYEVAVIMGHSSADTAQSHYAPQRKGWRSAASMSRPAIPPEEIARVRPGAKSSANERAGRPSTRTEALGLGWSSRSSTRRQR